MEREFQSVKLEVNQSGPTSQMVWYLHISGMDLQVNYFNLRNLILLFI